jgi:hypothetical protein
MKVFLHDFKPYINGTLDVHLLSQKLRFSRTLATHACNPSYLGGSDQEDLSSKPVLGK